MKRQHPEMRHDVQPKPYNQERSKFEPATGPATTGEWSPTLREPWSQNDFGDVVNAEGETVVDVIGCEVGSSDDVVRSYYEIMDLEQAYMRRIVACVNACEGISTEALEQPNPIRRVLPA